ncbi:MAG: baseplate J/gp47 family protein [Treponema sp.]|jgi:hypothetical protein|nr:baseplate J/gp47 family protein [Treponema sp.]
MPYIEPSTQELADRNLANIEARLNQNTPPAEKAFNRVISAMEAMSGKGLYAFARDRAEANLALTADADSLSLIGAEYDITRVPAKAWEGLLRFLIPDGETLSMSTVFLGPQGLRYTVTASATAPQGSPGSGALAPIVCEIDGPSGNLARGDTLPIQTPIAGFPQTAQAEGVTALGTDIEDLEDYRRRILDAERAEGGGGNAADYRSWAQSVPGVLRAYPFSGPPPSITPVPGQRVVYVEAAPEISADGIAPQSLLDLVRAAIITSEDGMSREILGLPIGPDLLYVRSIIRTPVYVQIAGLSVSSGSIGEAEDSVETALSALLRTFSPFVQGLDADFDELDEVVASMLAREAQNVLDAYGGTAENAVFGLSPGTWTGRYNLMPYEKLKLGGITFTEAGA